MNIYKNNYEAFFLDYHEGNLSPHQVADLLLFIEGHPELKEEFENFEIFTLEDYSLVEFENKNELKKEHIQSSLVGNNWNDLMISSIEGILTQKESQLLDQKLSADTKLKSEFTLFQKTKFISDLSIVFKNKEGLKRKKKKIIPLYYYATIAASVALLLNLLFLVNDNLEQRKLGDIKMNNSTLDIQKSLNKHSTIAESILEKKAPFNPNVNNALIIKKHIADIKKLVVTPESQEKFPITIENNIDLNNTENNPVLTTNNQQLLANMEGQEIKNLNSIKSTEIKGKTLKTSEYLSLRELATIKIKEKMVGENTLAIEKKTGHFKKFTGWDLAQLAAKGLNKLTGRNIKVKPTYNEQGDITAYSLNAGEFQIIRGR